MKADHCIRMAAKLEYIKPKLNEFVFREGTHPAYLPISSSNGPVGEMKRKGQTNWERICAGDNGDSFFIVYSGMVEIISEDAVVAGSRG